MADTTTSIFEKAKLHPKSHVKHVIAVLSGKGGVGKSFVTSLLATHLTQEGYRVGILDADVLGPSIPKLFGLTGKAEGGEGYILPQMSRGEVQIISAAMLLDGQEEPILWRGPLVSDLVRQFYTDVWWHELDYLLIDMPPGTGDIALTTFQKIPVSGIVIVTSPQQLVANIVGKAVKMAAMLRIPVLGVVENMSYVNCPHCNTKIELFGSSYSSDLAERYHVPLLARLPLISEMSRIVDEGKFETIRVEELREALQALIGLDQ